MPTAGDLRPVAQKSKEGVVRPLAEGRRSTLSLEEARLRPRALRPRLLEPESGPWPSEEGSR